MFKLSHSQNVSCQSRALDHLSSAQVTSIF